jgi:hypothetical protein
MNIKMLFVMFLLVGNVGGCVASDTHMNSSVMDRLPTSYAVTGTATAIVGIGIDKKGMPLETVKEVVLLPGQKVVFAGPDKFKIEFKNKKAPSSEVSYESENGVVIVKVPKSIFKSPAYARELKEKGFVQFNYSIFINGRELDPTLVVRREN